MTSRSQVEGTGRKTCALVLIDLTLLTDDEREPESWLLRKRSLSSDSSSVTWLAGSAATAGPALLLGDRDSHLACGCSVWGESWSQVPVARPFRIVSMVAASDA